VRRFFHDRGRIVRCNRRAEQLNPRTGYSFVTFEYRGRYLRAYAHRIIWQCFRGNIPRGFEINHLNGRKADNRLRNLRPVSRRDNVLHDFHVRGTRDLRGEKHNVHKLTNWQVIEIRRLYRTTRLTLPVIAARFGISDCYVSSLAHGTAWPHLKRGITQKRRTD